MASHDLPVICTMATYPPRAQSLRKVMATLLPQCDELRVYLNEFRVIPPFLATKKVVVLRSQDHGKCGDVGKFHGAERIKGYHFTVDDDIMYPPDYVARMVALLQKYNHKAVVGVHGSLINTNSFRHYYRTRKIYGFCMPASEMPVNVLGTGTVAFHHKTIRVSRDDFPVPNMADVWFAILGQRQRVPFMMVGRQNNWLRSCPAAKGTGSIHASSKHTSFGQKQTQVVKSYGDWTVHTP